MVLRLNVRGWRPVDVDEVTLDEVALDEVALDEAALDETVLDEVASDGTVLDEVALDEVALDEVAGFRCRCRFEYSAFVSTVGKAGQVTLAKYRSAAPKAVVAVSRSLSDVSVWTWNFARACHVANT